MHVPYIELFAFPTRYSMGIDGVGESTDAAIPGGDEGNKGERKERRRKGTEDMRNTWFLPHIHTYTHTYTTHTYTHTYNTHIQHTHKHIIHTYGGLYGHLVLASTRIRSP